MLTAMNNCRRSETPYPFIAGLRSGTTKADYERHAVLLMAVNDPDTEYLIHEPAMELQKPAKMVVPIGSILKGFRFLLPIEQRMIGKQ